MSDDLDRSISPASTTSEGDSARREFFESSRVRASPTPTPLSETPRDFQLTCGPTEIASQSGIRTNPALFTNGCNCGPECRQPCCVSVRGWTASKSKSVDPRSVDKSPKKLELARASGGTAVHIMAASSYPKEHDRVSVGSLDSGGSDHLGESHGETPLLPPDEQSAGFSSVAITVSIIISGREVLPMRVILSGVLWWQGTACMVLQ